MTSTKYSISVAGENALIVYFGKQPNAVIAQQIAQTTAYLRQSIGTVLIDLVPSYASLLVIYNPLETDHHHIRAAIRTALSETTTEQEANQGSLITLPVYYSEESGPDLQSLADRKGLSVAEVIAIHQQTEYRVYAIGFAPGFAYLSGLDSVLQMPRRETPRTRVPAGAVAIAATYSAVYPQETPGGWHLIGSTSTELWDVARHPPALIEPGRQVRFVRQ